MATLFVIATPIGNLKDISERAKTTLTSVDLILCEDTRVTGKLLSAYGIHTPMLSFHQHSPPSHINKMIQRLEAGHDLALVSDAGTPAISDPGGRLVEAVARHFKTDAKSMVVPIPGPCALVAALSVSGLPAEEFVFMGFPPNKKGRQQYFNRLAAIKSTAVIYESTHRIMKTLDEIDQRTPRRHLVVCRELTKVHETIYRGTAKDVTDGLKSSSIKGEFVIVLAPLSKK